MSAQTVARWNAIPLERPEGDTRNSYLKVLSWLPARWL